MRKVDVNKIFWGILLIAGAALLIADSMGVLATDKLNTINIILGVVLFGCFVHNLFKLSFSGMLFSLAFLCIVFDEFIPNMDKITPWPVLIAATLGSIGLSLIFPKKYRKVNIKVGSNTDNQSTVNSKVTTIDNEDGEYINVSTSFGAIVKYINSDNLKVVNADCKFGSMELYFDNAIIQGDEAVLNIDAKFSGVVLYVPKTWNIVNNTHASLGAVETERNDQAGNKTLVINGEVSLGAIEIKYI